MSQETVEIKKIALYTRVSTEDQAKEGFSLESQLERLRAYCTARAWGIYKEYVDPGYSGRNTRRPNYQQMLQDIDYWDGILVIKMDRIHRNRLNFIEMMKNLRKKDKQFISMQESLDTSTAMGRFVMGIIQDIAQLESEQTGERVAIAMIQKAKKGEDFIGHRVPFGYRWDVKKQRFIPVDAELEIVKRTFDLYLNGSIDPILETKDGWINEVTGKKIDGKEIKRLKTRYRSCGHSFRSIAKSLNKPHGTIKYYLNNIFYVGYERYVNFFRRINDGFQPIVSVEEWNRCQNKMREISRSKNYKPLLVPIDQPDAFKIDKELVKNIPVINRGKHNFNF
jgi:site-specific DNA recombinase